MWVAVALYAAATLLWVRILTTVPLSRAYPFVALAFVLVPAAGYLFFHEAISCEMRSDRAYRHRSRVTTGAAS